MGRVVPLILLFSMLLVAPVFAQNSKGDRSVGNQRQVRETKSKSIKKKERAKTKDIAGRRLRTKDKSSASRANASYRQPNPYASRPRVKNDRPAKSTTGRIYSNRPRGKERSWSGDVSGSPVRKIRPRTAEAARANVYPQRGLYVNNPSKKPRKEKVFHGYTRTASGQPIVRRVPQQKQRAWRGNMQGGAIGSPSATGQTKNIFPQKNQYSRYTGRVKNKGEKAISNRTVVSRAARLSAGPISYKKGSAGTPISASRSFLQRGRKNVYWGKFSKGERAVTTDLTGRPVRTRNFRSLPAGLVGRDTLKFFGRKPGGDSQFKGRARKGFVSVKPRETKGWRGDVSGWKLRRLQPKKSIEIAGKKVYPRKLSVSQSGKSGRPLPGGGYQSRSKPPEGRPGKNIPAISPGIGAKKISKALARAKGMRPLKGGGSVSGRVWNNNRTPIDPRIPPATAQRAGKFAGNIRRDQRAGFADQGEGFSGYIKRGRPVKGGGSVSGRVWNNKGQPVDVIQAGKGTIRASRFQGNLKGGRPIKGGGSVSGKLWNNNRTPIDPRIPPAGAQRAGKFAGNIRRDQRPGFADQGEGFSGYIKTSRPAKGGGSVSGKLWNNNGEPVDVIQAGKGTVRASQFQGNIKRGKPAKGGGSISGKLWNNNEEPILVRVPSSNDAREANYSGKKKIRRGYTQNPNSNEASIKKQRPDETTFRVDGLQVRVKRDSYQKKPNAAAGSLPGLGPSRSTVRASEYSRGVKVMWNKKHNPNSFDDALAGRQPSKKWERGVEHAGSMKSRYPYRHNPNSADDALKVLYLGKAYARIEDFQGNTKMKKFNSRELHPDARFAHSFHDNVKEERTILTNMRLMWAKLFRKSETQPDHLKKSERRPRYDKREQGMWND